MEDNESKFQQRGMDRWLDAALRARVDAEPRTGLEDRVLARLATEPQGNPSVWWPMVSAATAVIVIAITLILLQFVVQKQNIAKGTPKPSNATPAVHDSAASIAPTVAAANPRGAQPDSQFIRRREASCCDSPKPVGAIASNSNGSRKSLPMLATFPAPRPETAGERLLAQLASRHGSIDLAQDLSVLEFKIQPMEESPSDDAPQE